LPSSAPWWVAILPTVGLIVIFILFWVFFLQQSQGGGGSRVMSFGKSRAKMTVDDKKKITFEDVAGADEEKEELKEIVEFLKQPRKFVNWVPILKYSCGPQVSKLSGKSCIMRGVLSSV
jgi:cell division protease FtsH